MDREWAYIPHFYYDFYVYQYATSVAGGALLVKQVLDEGGAARERLLGVFRAGGSDYPYAILQRAGIDLASAEPYRALVARMTRVLDDIEAILKEPS
ncbi:MAG: oligoendopeptidase F family protein [Myxococcales bacterium]|nr:oligoendopeptidase F family protein [Myxococcales bacterium]